MDCTHGSSDVGIRPYVQALAVPKKRTCFAGWIWWMGQVAPWKQNQYGERMPPVTSKKNYLRWSFLISSPIKSRIYVRCVPIPPVVRSSWYIFAYIYTTKIFSKPKSRVIESIPSRLAGRGNVQLIGGGGDLRVHRRRHGSRHRTPPRDASNLIRVSCASISNHNVSLVFYVLMCSFLGTPSIQNYELLVKMPICYNGRKSCLYCPNVINPKVLMSTTARQHIEKSRTISPIGCEWQAHFKLAIFTIDAYIVAVFITGTKNRF
jgi:hypothetical protein